MATLKRPITIWLLLIAFFMPSLANGLKILFQQAASAEYRLYDAAGIGMVLYLLAIAIVALDGATLRYLWQPEPIGLKLGLASAAVGALIVIVTAAAALQVPDTLRAIVLEGHEKAGKTVSPEALDFTTSPPGVLVGVVLELAWIAMWSGVLLWNRPYFQLSSQDRKL